MADLLKTIRAGINGSKSLIELSVGLISLFSGLSSLLINLFNSKLSLLIVVTGLLIITLKVLAIIIHSQKKVLDISTNQFSNSTRKRAKIARIVLTCLYVAFLSYFGFSFFSSTKKCRPRATTDIIITNFSNDLSQDDCSYKLISLLKSKTESDDSIKTLGSTQFIRFGSSAFIDSIRSEFENFCSQKGLCVFGKRSLNEKLLDCNIYIHNLTNLHIPKTVLFKKNEILYLQNPDLINFSIENQTEIIANFILGILHLNLKNYEQSLNYLVASGNSEADSESVEFSYYRNFFIGNNYLTEGKAADAVDSYKKALKKDSAKSDCYYNLAIAYSMTHDFEQAKLALSKIEQNSDIKRQLLAILDKQMNISDTNYALKQLSSRGFLTTKYTKKSDSNLAHSDKNEIKAIKDGIQKNDTGKFGVYYNNGQILLPFKYDYIEEYAFKNKSFYIVQEGNRFGAFYKNGTSYMAVAQLSLGLVKNIIQADLDRENVNIGVGFPTDSL